jgi:hypothetical protein
LSIKSQCKHGSESLRFICCEDLGFWLRKPWHMCDAYIDNTSGCSEKSKRPVSTKRVYYTWIEKSNPLCLKIEVHKYHKQFDIKLHWAKRKRVQTGTIRLKNVVEIHLHSFLIVDTRGGEQFFSLPGPFSPWERAVCTLSIGCSVGSRSGLSLYKSVVPPPHLLRSWILRGMFLGNVPKTVYYHAVPTPKKRINAAYHAALFSDLFVVQKKNIKALCQHCTNYVV